MARFFGTVGFADSVESAPGVFKPEITVRSYKGDVIRASHQTEQGDKINDDIDMSVSISIVADEHAVKHSGKIKFVRWEGVPWVVTSVEPRRPRLILNLGSVYNGPTE